MERVPQRPSPPCFDCDFPLLWSAHHINIGSVFTGITIYPINVLVCVECSEERRDRRFNTYSDSFVDEVSAR